MSRYIYQATKAQSAMAVVMGVLMLGLGVWLFLNNVVIGVRFTDDDMGAPVSKVIWVLFALCGLVLISLGVASASHGEREVTITSDSITVPASEWKRTMVTLHRDQIRSVKVMQADNHLGLKVKYDGGTSKMQANFFASGGDFWKCANEIAAFAGQPLERPK